MGIANNAPYNCAICLSLKCTSVSKLKIVLNFTRIFQFN